MNPNNHSSNIKSQSGEKIPPSSISVVVPVFNSEGTLKTLIDRLDAVLKKMADDFEVILVNDGSQDHSWEIVRELVDKYDWVHGINLMRNYGQHNALLAGIRQANYEIVITLDDDLQNPPEEIPKLLAKLNKGFDVVFGKPNKEQHGLLRNLASQVTKLVLKRAMGADVARNVSAFRVFRTSLRDAFDDYRGPYVSIDVLLTWGTTRFAAIPVRHDPRQIGLSTYTLSKLITHAFNMMTGFSIVPLQIASLTGFLVTLFGLGVLAYVLGRYVLQGASVPGFSFLASIITIFSGAQLFTLGIIGEYLARMHFRMMNRPAYVVRDLIDGGEGQG
jgi:undecaprenyl-phosphate 4-deoxy-4-formamido-L-arabinose transferase